MPFEVTILGNNSAIPAHGRHPTSQVINCKDKLYLVDCGEGTQMQMAFYKIKKSRIDHIFISHLHGDHFFGLIGIITSYHLLHREEPLRVFGPAQLIDIINLQLTASNTKLHYELIFHPVNCETVELIFDSPDLSVTTIPMNHRIPCAGFLFREKTEPRKVLIEKIDELKIPYTAINDLKKGKDYIDGARTIKNEEVTIAHPSPRAYAFCSDTLYSEKIIPQISGVDLLYHESTFLEDSLERAKITFHSTAQQAGTIAKKAGVGKLLISHFSAKYDNLKPLLEEASAIFPDTELALEGKKFEVVRKD